MSEKYVFNVFKEHVNTGMKKILVRFCRNHIAIVFERAHRKELYARDRLVDIAT